MDVDHGWIHCPEPVLVLLRHAEQPCVAGWPARQRGCCRAANSRILIKLDQRELITRGPHRADRRAAPVRVAPAGAAFLDEVLPRQLSLEAGLPSQWQGEKREVVVQALDAPAVPGPLLDEIPAVAGWSAGHDADRTCSSPTAATTTTSTVDSFTSEACAQ
ncbi:hypothetical protein ACH4F6_30840 [Streptomyces sp. NPDC017936]|uniref:hypothetical protein n=1 Tax=Streptomyces sp. NPDC017936 TaxID=3365016 RepID=UPI0037A1E02D